MILSIYPLPQISYTHDASACLISDTGIAYAYEEEKASRYQHSIAALSEKSAFLGYRHVNIQPKDISSLVVTSTETCDKQSGYDGKIKFIKDLLLLHRHIPVHCVPHHLAHSALAVLTSPFEDCAFLTVDGGGDGIMGHWGMYKDGVFDIIEEFKFSPAIFYAYIACLAGFTCFEEGKVMGLSGYGSVNRVLYDWFKNHFWIREGSAAMEVSPEIRLEWKVAFDLNGVDADAFRRHKFCRVNVNFRSKRPANWLASVPLMDLARTGQLYFEELMMTALSNILKRVNTRNIALSGGAFQNVSFNGKLRQSLKCIPFIPFAPNDSGLSLGAGLLRWHQSTHKRPQHPLNPYLGPSYSSKDVKDTIESFSLKYEKPSDLCGTVAKAVSDGCIVGWFQGRAEFGARALGARSVLADPRSVSAKARVNQLLKKRDWFMPFAPSILERCGMDYLEDFTPSPYMNTAFVAISERRPSIPSAIHVDGTCRAHTVTPEGHPRYHELLERFFQLTGIPMILNTSFNRHGVPIVATPRQAIQHLMEGNCDILAIEDYIVYPERVPLAPPAVRSDDYYLAWEQLSGAARLLKRGAIPQVGECARLFSLPVSISAGCILVDNVSIWRADQPESMLEDWFIAFWDRTKRG